METDPTRQNAMRQALERVLSSSGFARNERLSRFLEVRAGRRDKALSVLQRQLSDARIVDKLARTYACLGDEEQALDRLEKWFTQNEPGLAETLQAPEITAMRTNPRVAALRKQVNLTP